MKSHTRGVMSIVLGVTQCIYGKKKLNTNISKEQELVGAIDYVPYNVW